MRRKLIRVRLFSIFAIIAMVFSLITPGLTLAESASINKEVEVTREEGTVSSTVEKIDPEVIKVLEKEGTAEILIEMKEQVDTTEVSANLVQELKSATAYEKKIAARYGVFQALKRTSLKTQTPILQYLAEEKNNGMVETYESFYVMNVIYAKTTQEVVEELASRPEVAHITLDQFVEMDWPELDEMRLQDDAVEWNIDRVQAADVWDDFDVDGTGVVIGVIDSGVDWEHDALQRKWRGFDPNNPDNPDTYGNWLDITGSSELPVDVVDHGTHVTGTIVGQDSAGENIVGVAPGAQWIAARAFTADGASFSDLLTAGEYMLAPEGDPSLAPDVIQNSWSGTPGMDEWFRPMVQAWRDAGQLPVFAAGNEGPRSDTVTHPGNYPESYAVAATDRNDLVADFSSRGPSPYDGDVKPDISAPGVDIRSTIPGGTYGFMNGTSMASPHIAGTAALLLSVDAGLTVDNLEEIMNDTAEPLTDDEYTEVPNDAYGVGIVNAYEAVESIAHGMGTIEGTVLKEGIDIVPPIIEHEPLDGFFKGVEEVQVTATVSDDVTVMDVELKLMPDGMDEPVVISMERVSGNHQEGVYQTFIPEMYIEDPGFQYVIQARDFGGNITETDEHWVDVIFGLVPGEYKEDFSTEPIGWTFDGDWEWGEPLEGPEPLVGNHLVATNLYGKYANDDHLLLMPPIDLRHVDEATLRLDHWYDIHSFSDVSVIVSNDSGENWDVAEVFSGRDQTWRSLYVNLADYARSEQPVQVGFLLESNAILLYNGWYIDNLALITGDSDAPNPPSNLQAEPNVKGVNLSWDLPEDHDRGLEQYHIYRADSSGGDYERIGTSTTRQFRDKDVSEGETYFYVVTSIDYAGNESDYSNEGSEVAPSVTVIFESDFENDGGGFIAGGENSSWEWGIPTSGPESAYVGEKLWASNLDGNMSANENSWLNSPEIDLRNIDNAELNFALWFALNNGWSYGHLEVTTDGGDSWERLKTYTGHLEPNWSEESFPLDDYLGEMIQIRFSLEGSTIRYAGMYVDDFSVASLTDRGDGLDETESSRMEKVDGAVDAESLHTDGHSEIRTTQEQEGIIEVDSDDDMGTESVVMNEEGLPIEAAVTVLETERTVLTTPTTGAYSLIHPANKDADETWTVQAAAYGFYTATEEIHLEDEETAQVNFMLEPLPRGDIEGVVVNERNGQPIEDARLWVVEDPRAAEGHTDSDGQINMEDIIEGEYTLFVSAPNYHVKEITNVNIEGGEATELTIEMRPFIGFEEEIAYDDGSAEKARAYFESGNGYAVKMTPNGNAHLEGVSLYFWDESFPTPGGNVFKLAIYDTDDDGNPSERVFETEELEGERNHDWFYVDLSEYDFVTDEDFYVVWLQTEVNTRSPGLGLDDEGPFSYRSYRYEEGSFEPFTRDDGNAMIRANVVYSLEAPIIDTPEDMTYTTEDSIMVSGTTTVPSEVNIYNNEDSVAVVETEELEYSSEILLTEGENAIVVEAEIDNGISDPSTLTVIKDTIAPELTIESPIEGEVTNQQVVHVHGHISDENLKEATVNGEVITVNEDDTYSEQIILEEGDNVITVEALDHVGHLTTQEVTIEADFTAPVIDQVEPSESITVSPGEEVTVSFYSDSEGGTASFDVQVPSKLDSMLQSNKMEEVEPGFYEGTWSVPHFIGEGIVIHIEHYDAAGNRTTAVADGTITIGESDPEQLVDRIFGELRYETAIEISQEGWDTADTVVLARGTEFADALAGVPLAHKLQAPILLTRSDELYEATLAEILRLGAQEVVILGGTGAIRADVEQDLEQAGLTVRRIGGETRFETAALIANEVAPDGAQQVVVTNGRDFPDAMSIASSAAKHNMPILLTREDHLPQSTLEVLDELGATETIVVGGYDVVTEDVVTDLPNVERLRGENRYETNIVVNEYFSMDHEHLFIATGRQYADALTGAVLAAKMDRSIVFVSDYVPQRTAEFLTENNTSRLTIFGGTNAVTQDVQQELENLLMQ